MYKLILVTGKTGSGKSKLMEAIQKNLPTQVHYVDPLPQSVSDTLIQRPITAKYSWDELDAGAVHYVVVDHFTNLSDEEGLNAAFSKCVDWCKKHEKPLLVVFQDINDLQHYKITKPDNFIHIDMDEIKRCHSPQDYLFSRLAEVFITADVKQIIWEFPKSQPTEIKSWKKPNVRDSAEEVAELRASLS